MKLKETIYRIVITPAILYGAETCATMKPQGKVIEASETRMLRWMCGVTHNAKIRKEHIRGTTVTQAHKKHHG